MAAERIENSRLETARMGEEQIASNNVHGDLAEIASRFKEIGVPDAWKNSSVPQSQYSPQEKGYVKKIAHKQCEYGVGIFAEEDLEENVIVRVGMPGKNVVFFRNSSNLPDANEMSQATKYYMQNYVGAEPQDLHVPRNTCERKADVINDFEQSLMYMWIPGCGINHANSEEGANAITVYDPETDCMYLKTTKAIAAGTEFRRDYNDYGQMPTWWEREMTLRENDGAALFKGHNDFVN